MKTLLLLTTLCLTILFSGPEYQQPPITYEPQNNPYSHPGRFEMAPRGSIPTFNPYAPQGEEWTMKPEGYKPQPNPYNGKIE